MALPLEDAQEKPTYEQLEYRLAQFARDIEDHYRTNRQLRSKIRELRLILLGMTTEQLHLRVHVDPAIITGDVFTLAQELVAHHAKRAAHEIEQKMGGPLDELRDALMHINYLENHARNQGLPFKGWEWRQKDRGLMDAPVSA